MLSFFLSPLKNILLPILPIESFLFAFKSFLGICQERFFNEPIWQSDSGQKVKANLIASWHVPYHVGRLPPIRSQDSVTGNPLVDEQDLYLKYYLSVSKRDKTSLKKSKGNALYFGQNFLVDSI